MKNIVFSVRGDRKEERGGRYRYNRSHPVALGENCRYLSAWHGREINYSTEAGASRLIHMDIGEVLYTRITMADSDGFRKNMERIRHETGKKRLT